MCAAPGMNLAAQAADPGPGRDSARRCQGGDNHEPGRRRTAMQRSQAFMIAILGISTIGMTGCGGGSKAGNGGTTGQGGATGLGGATGAGGTIGLGGTTSSGGAGGLGGTGARPVLATLIKPRPAPAPAARSVRATAGRRARALVPASVRATARSCTFRRPARPRPTVRLQIRSRSTARNRWYARVCRRACPRAASPCCC